MAIRYPPYRPPEARRFGRVAALGHALRIPTRHVLHTFFARTAAVALYVGAVVVVFVIVAPSADLFRKGAAEATASAASVPTRHLVVGNPTSVSALALRLGTTPFTLYALNRHRLHGAAVRDGARLRVPAI